MNDCKKTDEGADESADSTQRLDDESDRSRLTVDGSRVVAPDSKIMIPELRVADDELPATVHGSRPLWYVIQTKPTKEGDVQQHLRNAQFETFLPRIQSMIRGRKGLRTKSLFPSYLFAFIDLNDPELYRMIKYTRGVRKILGDGLNPVPVPSEMIEIIREHVNQEGIVEQKLVLKKGDAVRIRSGVFKDLVGILEKPVSAEGRVRVLLQIVHHQVQCNLSAGDVERVTD